MKKLVFIMLSSFLSASCISTIIFLQGTGCAGKTSICASLVSQNCTWKVVDEDELFYNQAPINWTKRFGEHMAKIAKVIAQCNLFHAIARNEILFLDEAQEFEKEQAYAAIFKIRALLDERTPENRAIKKEWQEWTREFILAKIYEHARNGYNVIVDTWFTKPERFEDFRKEFNVILVLAYAPFGSLVTRTISRNEKIIKTNNISQVRFFHQALMSFAGQYDLIPASEIEANTNYIDTLSFDSLRSACDLVEMAMQESSHAIGAENLVSRGEFSFQTFGEFCRMLENKFKGEKFCYVVPKLKYDILIRTDKMMPDQAAQLLV